jgi:prepilin-type N-terminal cleavage/methylation domain-containing protein
MKKKAFTLIELLVSLSIIGIMFSYGIPAYDNYILKGKFEEAKVTLQALMLGQERHRIETGKYYSVTTGSIDNEKMIGQNLKVDLTKSNNFAYQIIGIADGSYRIKALLKPDLWDKNCDTDSNNPNYECKMDGTLAKDDWVSNYTRGTNNHYLEVRFPTPLPNAFANIDYTHMYK